MENTTNLKLPLLIPNQSGKEITHNEALVIIDNILQNGVIDKDLTTPPENPNSNDIYIVSKNATGDWADKDKQIAFYDNGWRFVEPREGFIFWVNDEDKLYTYNGSKWVEAIASSGSGNTGGTSDVQELNDLSDVEITSAGKYDILQHDGTDFVNTKSIQQLTMLGINATADSDNKLSVKSDYVLFDKSTDNSRVKVNKATSTDTASHLFQTNYGGRAEFGLIGDDDFTLKVSNDGETWNNAFVVDRATGNIDFKGTITNNGNSLQSGNSGSIIALNQTVTIENNTTEIEFTNLDINKKHIFEFYNIYPNATNADIFCQLSSNETYISSYRYSSMYANVNNAGAYFGNANVSQIPLNASSVGGYYITQGISGKIDFYNFAITGIQYINFESATNIGGVNIFTYFGKSDCNLNGNKFDKIKFYLSNGTFKSGIIKHFILD